MPVKGDRSETGAQSSSLRAEWFEFFLFDFPGSFYLIDYQLAIAVDSYMFHPCAIGQFRLQKGKSFDQGAVFGLIVGHFATIRRIVATFDEGISGGAHDVKTAISLARIRIGAPIEGDDIRIAGRGKRGGGVDGRLPQIHLVLAQAAASSRARASALICSARLGGTGW